MNEIEFFVARDNESIIVDCFDVNVWCGVVRARCGLGVWKGGRDLECPFLRECSLSRAVLTLHASVDDPTGYIVALKDLLANNPPPESEDEYLYLVEFVTTFLKANGIGYEIVA